MTIEHIKIPKGEIYLLVEGEGVCDYCGKEITQIYHTVNFGDFCLECRNKIVVL